MATGHGVQDGNVVRCQLCGSSQEDVDRAARALRRGCPNVGCPMTPTPTTTPRQRTVLQSLLTRDRATARYLGVRADVLWRLEQKGLVTRNSDGAFALTGKGRREAEA